MSEILEEEVMQAKAMDEVMRQLGVNDATYCRCRKEYARLRVYQAMHLNEMEQKNTQLLRISVKM